MFETINNWALLYETQIRTGLFVGTILLLALAEFLFPRRLKSFNISQTVRWVSNLGIVTFNNLIMRLILPLMAFDMAFIAQKNNWGLFNHYEISTWINVILTIVILDLVIYLQHVMFHAVPIFWRAHKTHHADLDFDVTTGIRFHPLEVILSMGIKIAAVAIIGASPFGVLAFEVLLNATSMFSHSNLKLPLAFDRILRLGIVTPDMHRVHHSIIKKETNSNFGFNLSIWDRIFGTYIDQPSEGHLKMMIGINEFRNPKFLRFHWILLIPFIRKSTNNSSKDNQ